MERNGDLHKGPPAGGGGEGGKTGGRKVLQLAERHAKKSDFRMERGWKKSVAGRLIEAWTLEVGEPGKKGPEDSRRERECLSDYDTAQGRNSSSVHSTQSITEIRGDKRETTGGGAGEFNGGEVFN